VGYYVNNEHNSEELKENPPTVPQFARTLIVWYGFLIAWKHYLVGNILLTEKKFSAHITDYKCQLSCLLEDIKYCFVKIIKKN
jgi:hypothetical protein